MADFKCPDCGALQKDKHIKEGICWRCETEISVSEWCDVCGNRKTLCKCKKETKKGVFPKCPNPECELHTNPINPKEAFAINVIEHGLLGKVLKSNTANMISCVKCGHIIGVSSKGG